MHLYKIDSPPCPPTFQSRKKYEWIHRKYRLKGSETIPNPHSSTYFRQKISTALKYVNCITVLVGIGIVCRLISSAEIPSKRHRRMRTENLPGKRNHGWPTLGLCELTPYQPMQSLQVFKVLVTNKISTQLWSLTSNSTKGKLVQRVEGYSVSRYIYRVICPNPNSKNRTM